MDWASDFHHLTMCTMRHRAACALEQLTEAVEVEPKKHEREQLLKEVAEVVGLLTRAAAVVEELATEEVMHWMFVRKLELPPLLLSKEARLMVEVVPMAAVVVLSRTGSEQLMAAEADAERTRVEAEGALVEHDWQVVVVPMVVGEVPIQMVSDW